MKTSALFTDLYELTMAQACTPRRLSWWTHMTLWKVKV